MRLPVAALAAFALALNGCGIGYLTGYMADNFGHDPLECQIYFRACKSDYLGMKRTPFMSPILILDLPLAVATDLLILPFAVIGDVLHPNRCSSNLPIRATPPEAPAKPEQKEPAEWDPCRTGHMCYLQ